MTQAVRSALVVLITLAVLFSFVGCKKTYSMEPIEEPAEEPQEEATDQEIVLSDNEWTGSIPKDAEGPLTGEAAMLAEVHRLDLLVTIKSLQVRSAAAKGKLPPKDKVSLRLLRQADQRLASYKKELQEAKTEETIELLAHRFDHENIAEMVTHAEKMVTFKQELAAIQLIASDLQRGSGTRISIAIPTEPTETTVQPALDAIKKHAPVIEKYYQQKQYGAAIRQVETLQKAAVPVLLQYELSMKLMNPSPRERSTTTRATTSALARQLRTKLQTAFPTSQYYPAQEQKEGQEQIPEEHRFLVCRMTVTDGASPTVSFTSLNTIFQRVNNYLQEAAFGKVKLLSLGEVQGQWDGARPTDVTSEIRAAVDACGAGIDGTNADTIVIYPSITISSNGLYARRNVITEDGQRSIQAVLVKDRPEYSLSATMAHEFGHRFTFKHANAIDCETAPFATTGCAEIEYGNPFDIMGFSSAMGHFNGWFKSKAGWATATTVQSSGTYHLNALEDENKDAAHVLYIPSKGLCIEHRKPIGYDDYVARAGEAPTRYQQDIMRGLIIPPNGALLLYKCGMNEQGRPTSFLLDTKPATYSGTSQTYGEFSDALIQENTVFKDASLGVTISFKRSTQNRHWADVSVEIG